MTLFHRGPYSYLACLSTCLSLICSIMTNRAAITWQPPATGVRSHRALMRERLRFFAPQSPGKSPHSAGRLRHTPGSGPPRGAHIPAHTRYRLPRKAHTLGAQNPNRETFREQPGCRYPRNSDEARCSPPFFPRFLPPGRKRYSVRRPSRIDSKPLCRLHSRYWTSGSSLAPG